MWLVDCCAHGYVVPTTVGTQLQYCRVGGIVLMNPSHIWWWTASTKFLLTTPGKPHTTVGHGPTHRVLASGKALWSGAGPWGWHGVHCWQPFYSTGIQPAPSWPPPCAVQVHPIWLCDVNCSRSTCARSFCTLPLHSYAQLATATRTCQRSGPRRAPPDTAVNE